MTYGAETLTLTAAEENALRRKVLRKIYGPMVDKEVWRIRWLEDVIADLRRMGISGWMEKARNRDQWMSCGRASSSGSEDFLHLAHSAFHNLLPEIFADRLRFGLHPRATMISTTETTRKQSTKSGAEDTSAANSTEAPTHLYMNSSIFMYM